MTEMADLSEVDRLPDQAAARAVAAAVAVAVSLAEHGTDAPQVKVSAADAWNVYVRSQHVSRRARYDALRVRG